MALEGAARANIGIRVMIVTVVAVPLLFALSGLAIRYAAFASVSAESGFAAYAKALCRWDCSWYIDISEKGYER
ncbi:MAG: hypothetical protein E5V56_12400, partial [Mesorhizobium sp.]